MNFHSLRIVQIIDSLELGGAERMAVNIANVFASEGMVSHLVVTRSPGPLYKMVNNGVSVKFLNKKNTFDLKSFYQLFKIILDIKPHVIHAHSTSIYWAVILKFFNPRIKLIWHDHLGIADDVVRNNPRNEVKIFERWIDIIITSNEKTRDWWRSKFRKKVENIHYIKNFPFLTLEPAIKSKIPVFLHLANYRSEKGQMDVIEAANILKVQNKALIIRLVGQRVDKEWTETLEKMILENDLKEMVHLEGPVEDIASTLREVHAGIVASEREGLPVALLEYGLAALPVISTRVGQCPEVLNNGEFGILVSPNSPAELADAILKTIDNMGQAQVVGEAFRLHVHRHYGQVQFLTDYKKYLDLNFTEFS